MPTSDFIGDIISKSSDPDVSLWASKLSESIAEQTIYGCRLLDRLAVDLQASYWRALESALTAMPPYKKIGVPADVLDFLEGKAASRDEWKAIAGRIYRSSPRGGLVSS